MHAKYMLTPAMTRMKDGPQHYNEDGPQSIPKSSAMIIAAFSPMRNAVEAVFFRNRQIPHP